MSIEFDSDTQPLYGAVIKVIGVGGGGGNALDTMIESDFTGVEFIAANTDKQALANNKASVRVQLGRKLTNGLGAGGKPEIGRSAAEEDTESLRSLLNGADMVFVTAGMGGGTGTGAAPVIAKISRDMNILTVAVVTTPFFVEGVKRQRQAETGLDELRKFVDTLIIIPNERLLDIVGQESLEESFKKVDGVLLQAVKGVSDLINRTGQMNLDFADIKSVMKNSKGVALVGIGSGSGEDRAKKAARAAITSPLLGNLKIDGATGLIVNITSGSNISLKEIIDAVSYIKDAAGGNADVKMGVVRDESLANEVKMTVVATGITINNYEETPVVPEIKTTEQPTITKKPTVNVSKNVTESQTLPLFGSSEEPAETTISGAGEELPPFLRRGGKISTEFN